MSEEKSKMMRTSLYIERDIKEEADKVFKELGIPFNTAMKMFLVSVVAERGLPQGITHCSKMN